MKQGIPKTFEGVVSEKVTTAKQFFEEIEKRKVISKGPTKGKVQLPIILTSVSAGQLITRPPGRPNPEGRNKA
ncbi:unnamed protein product [Dovyalis caffra]|uniref:Uncharacterized protein n=1 Tax=Dovyalis caffra TaxID=77055 RepID=A0AAV1RA14_9ROSI|nr:unnamed protein product [Dovyalis caffra]